MADKPRALLLKNYLSPGDVLAMTACVHSLVKKHPGKFLIQVDTTAPAFWEHSPDLATREEMAPHAPPEEVQTHYPAINECNQRGIHFLQAYCEFLEHALKVPVPLATNRPMLYLSRQEREWLPQVEEATGKPTRYWVVCAGRKSDYTAKFWGSASYQRVVDLLRGRVLFVQAGSAEHYHPPLKGVINLVGKTDLRQLVRLIHHASGVLSGVTLFHHLAAALEKPSVCIMGGREPVMWNTYPKCQLLHTIGALPCCRDGGCWKSRVEKLGDGSEQDNSLCDSPVPGEEAVPRCMALIRPEEVAAKIALTAGGGLP